MDFSLNYVWRQAEKLSVPKREQKITCPIPQKLMDNVVGTARQYSPMSVNLWVDIYGIGGHSNAIMQELNGLDAAQNITFKALDTIPAYRINSLFEKPFDGFENAKGTIWQQVDLARLYVLRECLLNGKEEAALYADMDVIVPPGVFDIVEKCGMVTNVSSKNYLALAENQLFGFSKDRLLFLLSDLLPETAKFIKDGHNGWRGHVDVFCEDSSQLKASGLSFDAVGLEISCIEEADDIKKSYQKASFMPSFS